MPQETRAKDPICQAY